MTPPDHFLALLGVVLFFGLLLPQILRPLHLPFATSLILVGSLLGPHGLATVAPDESLVLFGFLGATFQMLLAGTESRKLDIGSSRRHTAGFLLLNGALPAVAGTAIARAFGYGWTPSLCVGTVFLSSSIMLVFGMVEAGVFVPSLAALIGSARFVVAEAVWLAQLLELPENLIGLSLVAVGTSLPELLVSVTAVRKSKAELAVGNVMGSNIANTLLILGLSATVSPLEVAELAVVYTVPIMLFFSLALLYFVRTDWRISRVQGGIAVLAYTGFLAAAFLQGWG